MVFLNVHSPVSLGGASYSVLVIRSLMNPSRKCEILIGDRIRASSEK